MSDTPKISDEVAILARTFMEDVATGNLEVEGKSGFARLSAANNLYRFYQAQQKFGHENMAKLAKEPRPPVDVRDYVDLTDDELNAKIVAIRGAQAG